jgi:HEAT repeat protein
MKRSGRGRSVAWTATAIGIVVLLVAAFLCRGLLYQEIDIRKLRSKDSREVLAAAERLAAMRSARAVPGLLDLIKGEKTLRDAGPLFDSLKRCASSGGHHVIEGLTDFLFRPEGCDELRFWAARELILRQPRSEHARKVLLDFLRDGSRGWEAFDLLEGAGAETVPALVHRLDRGSRDPGLIFRLGLIGPAAAPAVPCLERLLDDPSAPDRISAVLALDQIGAGRGRLRPVLLDALARSDSKPVWLTPETVSILGDEAAPSLARFLAEPGSEDRAYALYILRQIPGDAVRSLDVPVLRDALREALRDPDPRIAGEAAEVLVRLGRMDEARALVPVLLEKLRSPGDSPPPEIPPVLARIAPPEAAVPALVAALEVADGDFREAAIDALGEIGPPAREAVPRLARLFRDPDDSIRRAALEAILSIGPSGPVEGIEEALADSTAEVRILAAGLFVRQDPRKGARMVQGIIDGLFYETESIRQASERALRFLGRDVRAAAPALLRRALKEESLHVEAASALVRMGLGEEEIRVLTGDLRFSLDKRRANAALIFREAGPVAKAAVPELIRALDDPSELVRMRAIEGLGAMGPDAKDAAEPLRGLARSRRKSVRDLAREALRKIGEAR